MTSLSSGCIVFPEAICGFMSLSFAWVLRIAFITIDGKRFGGSYDVPAYTPDSYAKPGVPQGHISEKFVHTSELYDGMQSDYWIYVPAQYNPGGARRSHGLAGWRALCHSQ